MNIAVVGLGLIGGSFCKAISRRTEHICFGIDINKDTINSALNDNAIQKSISNTELINMDITIICLHPKSTIEFIINNLDNFKQGSIVIDTCGVKTAISNKVFEELSQHGLTFIGCHPMAGREFSGYEYSLETLFDNASFIVTPEENVLEEKIQMLQNLIQEIGFKKFIVTTKTEHDKIIAFTSQLAHVVSSAYIKSPTLSLQNGFSAGSFQDLTRVAKLNENMWTELFLMNKEPLLFEIDEIIQNLTDFKTAIKNDNANELNTLLKEGRILKEKIPYNK